MSRLGHYDERIEAMITDATIYLMEQVQGWAGERQADRCRLDLIEVWFAC
jgi:hypothetical protein